jgi:4-carboxymuconolactone decarboxylase
LKATAHNGEGRNKERRPKKGTFPTFDEASPQASKQIQKVSSMNFLYFPMSPRLCVANRNAWKQPFQKENDVNDDLFEQGMEIRKAVVGTEHVEKSMAAADDFNMPMQRLVTEYCWGAVWGREELPKKTRSMLNIAMLAVLNRPNEFKLHVRGAIRNGVSKDEIREILLQVAIYAGVPAAIDSFRNAKDALADLDE